DAVFVEDGAESQIAPLNRQFNYKSIGNRAITIFVGPLMNFVIAFIVFMIIGFLQGVPTQEPLLVELVEDGDAAEAGLQEGD
ncbi:M50 family metallopeptidase, partial [Jeotgalibacillus sp. ET6]|uniref:M50 family metallopeptidase n=1 Tax=Jeotgalibacillus sp. ET6 TaxID=3037260 RepID=UPI002418A5ED